jgi:signal peptidase I
VTCPQCGFQFPVNCSAEVDPQEGARARIVGATCPNCRQKIRLVNPDPRYDGRQPAPPRPGDEVIEILDPSWGSGDRVLVAKSLFEFGLMRPERRDVVVFKFPGDDRWPNSGPQLNHVPMNYIKRLIGLGGETIGIWYGKLYVMNDDHPDEEDRQARPVELWKKRYMHEDKFKDELQRFDDTPPDQRRFHILRKRPDKIVALKRPVYDNDHPAKDLENQPRWASEQESAWTKDEAHGFKSTGGDAAAVQWLRYRHLLRPQSSEGGAPRPQLITDFMGYNSFESVSAPDNFGGGHHPPPQNWVGDLILECDVVADRPSGDLVLELSKGVDRFRARWDLAGGTCTLFRIHDGKEEELGKSQPSVLRPGTTHRVRLANVDERLTVWVDGTLPFGDGVTYEPARNRGPTAANDLQPASIGVRGAAVSVHHLKLWRDTYYTLEAGPRAADAGLAGDDWADPDHWGALKHLPAKTLFVQPGHYLCLGDNSPESSDGRTWGTVPERLMLGRALLVYYPFKMNVPVLYSPVNRVGPIR